MIEVIYKDESQEGQNGEEPFGLPRNIRQIGLAAEDYRIYMEDYVYTFLVRLARTEDSLGEAKTRVAVLTGNLKWRSQTAYLFIKGAIIAEEMEAAPDHIDFSENQWKQIQEAQKEYFEDQEIVGWFFSQPQLLLKVSEVMSKVHMKHFGGEKVLMLMEPQEREDAFFRYENNEMVRLGGYYLYYEKNPGMQTYMIDKNEELQPEPQEKYEDQAVKDFRKIIADKKETRKEPAAPSVFSYGLTACLAIAVLTVGVNFYRSYQNVKQNEKESATVSSVIVEEITPSPVVGTSNNEAVRQHKQYRTDIIQNDAGKNKKNNLAITYSPLYSSHKSSYQLLLDVANNVGKGWIEPKIPFTIKFAPFKAKSLGLPFLELGDYVTFDVDKWSSDADGNPVITRQNVQSIIFNKTMSGINALSDEYEAKND